MDNNSIHENIESQSHVIEDHITVVYMCLMMMMNEQKKTDIHQCTLQKRIYTNVYLCISMYICVNDE
jgi:hypothetical protein